MQVRSDYTGGFLFDFHPNFAKNLKKLHNLPDFGSVRATFSEPAPTFWEHLSDSVRSLQSSALAHRKIKAASHGAESWRAENTVRRGLSLRVTLKYLILKKAKNSWLKGNVVLTKVLFFAPVILVCKQGIWKPLEKETCKVPYRMRTCFFKEIGFGEKSRCFDTLATCPSFVKWLQDKTNPAFSSVKLSFASTELSNPFPAGQFVSTNPEQKWSQHRCSRGELTACSFHTGIFAPTSLCSHWSFQSHCNLLLYCAYCANKQSRRELPSSMVVFISCFLSWGREREIFCTN